jgi:hypothetical protein
MHRGGFMNAGSKCKRSGDQFFCYKLRTRTSCTKAWPGAVKLTLLVELRLNKHGSQTGCRMMTSPPPLTVTTQRWGAFSAMAALVVLLDTLFSAWPSSNTTRLQQQQQQQGMSSAAFRPAQLVHNHLASVANGTTAALEQRWQL